MTRPIKLDDVVKTADGSMGDVHDIGRGMATVWIDGEESRAVTLPVDELRRVPDPRNRRPPIENLPVERPRCAFCNKPLSPAVNDERRGWGGPRWSPRITRRTFVRWNCYGRTDDGRGAFCTLSCALHFARAAFAAGYRITRAKSQ
jgi:hypothetical protein